MSNMLKCPNPTCPYVFDPSQVPAGVVLSCPRCAMQFTLGPPAPAATAAPPQHFPGRSAPAAPAAPPPPAPESEFEQVGQMAAEERDSDEPLPGRRTNKAQVFILAGVVSVLMAATVLVVVFAFLRRGKTDPASSVSKDDALNIARDAMPAAWKQDDDLRNSVGPPYRLAYKRENPEAYVAFGATVPKIKGRAPRPGEMKAELMQPFQKLFDISTVSDEPPLATTWLNEGISATRPFPNGFKFRAQSRDGMIWVGEAYTVAYKGIAYYWMNWCGEKDLDALKDEFASLRGKFRILEPGREWKETHSNVNDYKGDKVPYTISDTEEVWKEVSGDEFKALKEVEPDLDKRLRINQTPRRDRKALPDTAELSVYIVDGTGDPLQVARKYAEGVEKARIEQASVGLTEPLTPPTFREITDEQLGDPVSNTVPQTAPYVRLESNVKESRDAARLIVVSGLKVDDKIVVVRCWCEYRKRDVFETKFVQIAASLR